MEKLQRTCPSTWPPGRPIRVPCRPRRRRLWLLIPGLHPASDPRTGVPSPKHGICTAALHSLSRAQLGDGIQSEARRRSQRPRREPRKPQPRSPRAPQDQDEARPEHGAVGWHGVSEAAARAMRGAARTAIRVRFLWSPLPRAGRRDIFLSAPRLADGRWADQSTNG